MQIDMRLARCSIANNDVIKVKMGLTEGLHDLISHLEAPLADAGSHGYSDTVSASALTAHLLHDSLTNTSHGATPSRVGHCNDTRLTVNQNDGHTISGIYADNNALQFCHKRIDTLKRRLLFINVKRAEMFINNCYTARMRLARHDQVVEVHAQLHCQRES